MEENSPEIKQLKESSEIIYMSAKEIEDYKSIYEVDVLFKRIEALQISQQDKEIQEIEDIMQKYRGNATTKMSTINHYAYNYDIKADVQRVSQMYPITIDVKGDGNCFYRSFILHYLLKIFQPCDNQYKFPKSQIEIFFNFLKEVETINPQTKFIFPKDYYQFQVQKIKDIFLMQMLSFFEQFLKKQNIMEIIMETLNNVVCFDISCVVICRLKIAQTFIIHKRNPAINQLQSQQDLQGIENLLLTYRTEGQDMILKLAAQVTNNLFIYLYSFKLQMLIFKISLIDLKQSFQCRLVIQNLYVDYNQGGKIVSNNQIFEPYKGLKENAYDVSVLYTNGHYLCLIDKYFTEKQEYFELQQKKYREGTLDNYQNNEIDQGMDLIFDLTKREQQRLKNEYKEEICKCKSQELHSTRELKCGQNSYQVCQSVLKEEINLQYQQISKDFQFQIYVPEIKQPIWFFFHENQHSLKDLWPYMIK